MAPNSPFLLKAEQIEASAVETSHPWNPNSQLIWTQMARITGMTRAIVSHAALPPGKESFVYHSHHHEEEWVYIIAGTGLADIDGQTYPVGPGDFMGFPTPSAAHHLRNTGDSDLVYLMGGECLLEETADFPDLGKRKIRVGEEVSVIDLPADADG